MAELRSAASRRRLPWSRQRGAAKRPDGGEDGGAVQAAAPPATASSPPGSLLEVTDLAITIPTETGLIEAVRGVSLAIAPGETLGIVGESGSGKTMLALSLLGLLPRRAQVTGSVAPGRRGTAAGQRGPLAEGSGRPGRDGVPGSDDRAEPDVHASAGRSPSASGCISMISRTPTLRSGRSELLDAVGLPEPAHDRAPVPARAVRRHAPAGRDRDGDRQRARTAHRGRADHGAGRHRPGADPRPAEVHPAGDAAPR